MDKNTIIAGVAGITLIGGAYFMGGPVEAGTTLEKIDKDTVVETKTVETTYEIPQVAKEIENLQARREFTELKITSLQQDLVEIDAEIAKRNLIINKAK
jgi:hypothetical protein